MENFEEAVVEEENLAVEGKALMGGNVAEVEVSSFLGVAEEVEELTYSPPTFLPVISTWQHVVFRLF